MNNLTNGRAYLNSNQSVAAGAPYEFVFNITAPANASGSVKFSVQMVQDGVQWFGESYVWSIPVVQSQTVSSSKLSIQTEFGRGDGLSLPFILQSKPRVVKLFNNFERAAIIKAASPGTKIVGRIYWPTQPKPVVDQNDNPDLTDANAKAYEWWNYCCQKILQNPSVDYWEGMIMPETNTVGKMKWLNQFEITRIYILWNTSHLKACIGNFSVGNPDTDNHTLIAAFYGAIDNAIAYGGVLGLQEYNAPTMTSGNYSYFVTRYRKFYEHLRSPYPDRPIPLIITECGIANQTVFGPPDTGWKDPRGNTPLTPGQYFDQLKWYDNELQKDNYVLGATIFCFEFSSTDWLTFEIAGELSAMLQGYIKDGGSYYYDGGTGADAGPEWRGANVFAIKPGSYWGWASRSLDLRDYFKLTRSDGTPILPGNRIVIDMYSPSGADFDLYLCSPTNGYVTTQSTGAGVEHIDYTIPNNGDPTYGSGGNYRIQIYAKQGEGVYWFTATVY